MHCGILAIGLYSIFASGLWKWSAWSDGYIKVVLGSHHVTLKPTMYKPTPPFTLFRLQFLCVGWPWGLREDPSLLKFFLPWS